MRWPATEDELAAEGWVSTGEVEWCACAPVFAYQRGVERMWVQAVTVEWPAKFIEHARESCPMKPVEKAAEKQADELVDENGQRRMF